MKRILTGILMMTATLASAATLVASPAQPVIAQPGDQTDPHISGSLIAYTDRSSGTSQIFYYDLTLGGGAGTAVPNMESGTSDLLSDISGTRVVYVRTSSGAEFGNIYVYDTATTFAGAQLIGGATGGRTSASIGGNTVAFEDVNGSSRRILAVDLANPGTTINVATTGNNYDPSVSADGSAIAYIRCDGADTNCEAVVASGVGFATSTSFGPVDGPESGVDASATHIVFISGGDLHYAPIAGGGATAVATVGTDKNPNISGNYVAYEHFDGTQTDIYLKDITSAAAPMNLTNTPGVSEQLNDISVDGTTIRVVYAAPGNGLDIFVIELTVQTDPAPTPDPCVDTKTQALGGGNDDDDDDGKSDDDDDGQSDDDDDDNDDGSSGGGGDDDDDGEGGNQCRPPDSDEDHDNGYGNDGIDYNDQGKNEKGGCSASGTGNAALLLGLFAAFLIFRRQPLVVRSRMTRR